MREAVTNDCVVATAIKAGPLGVLKYEDPDSKSEISVSDIQYSAGHTIVYQSAPVDTAHLAKPIGPYAKPLLNA